MRFSPEGVVVVARNKVCPLNTTLAKNSRFLILFNFHFQKKFSALSSNIRISLIHVFLLF